MKIQQIKTQFIYVSIVEIEMGGQVNCFLLNHF
jgi:hypothetical protein